MLVRRGDGVEVTFSSMALYNAYKLWDTEAKLVSQKFVPEKLTKVVQAKIIKKELPEKVVEIDTVEFNPSSYSTRQFRQHAQDFTIEQLKQFAKDKRKVISKEAKILINNVSKH